MQTAEQTEQLAPGFHDLTPAQYHADPCPVPSLSSSIARTLISKSPRHAYTEHPKLGGGQGKISTDEMEFGELAHRLLLGKGADVAVFEGDTWRGKEAAAFWDEAVAAGRIPAKRKDVTRAEALADRARQQFFEMGITALNPSADALSEAVAIWQEGETWCRAMIDRLVVRESSGCIEIFDLKTMSQSAHPKACAARIAAMDYDLQQAHYTQGVQKLRPDTAGRIKFTFLFVETSAPFAVTPVQLNGEWATVGFSKWSRALAQWGVCMKTHDWPGYADGVVTVEAPAWALPAELGA